jgi:hypothetical protein
MGIASAFARRASGEEVAPPSYALACLAARPVAEALDEFVT